MLKNWLRIMVRNLLRHKTYSLLNISGLAIGMTCAALIFLWVENETSFDQHHEKKDRIYGIMQHWKMENEIHTWWSTPSPLAVAAKQQIPGIEEITRTSEAPESPLVSVGERSFYSSGLYAEPAFFRVFTVPFTEGRADKAFPDLFSILLTEKAALKFFGTTANIAGKKIRFNHTQDHIVTAVVKDPPSTSTFQYEWIAPYAEYEKRFDYLKNWGSNSIRTYLLLKPGAHISQVNDQLATIIKTNAVGTVPKPFLISINDWRLRSDFSDGKQTGGRGSYVRLFAILAWIILGIACINFMNLSTARSEKRAKEVGVKKVLGAERRLLVLQFLIEALCMSFLAAAVALAALLLVLPSFNLLVNKDLTLSLFTPLHFLFALLVIIFCGVIAGSYPSLYLSSFKPVFVFKGLRLKTSGAAYLRRALVVVQFTISITLIIGTLVVYQQMKHVKSREIGIDKEKLIILKAKGDLMNKFDVVKTDLLNTGFISNAAMADYSILEDGNNTDNFYWEGKDKSVKILTSLRMVGPGYMQTTGLKIIEGRDFNATDSSAKPIEIKSVIITRALANVMGKGTAVGKKIYAEGASGAVVSCTVIGVTENFIYGDMYGMPDPVIFYYTPSTATSIYVRSKPGFAAEQVVQKLEAVMKKHAPAYPMEYAFVSDQFNNKFSGESLVADLSKWFAILAIFICCLGLFGLAAQTVEQRVREIGIRKVMGASRLRLTRLLTADFLKLVLFSCLLAFPVAYWMLTDWLRQYDYRISLGVWFFAFAGAMAILLALLTVGFQTVRAASANPVNTLRSE